MDPREPYSFQVLFVRFQQTLHKADNALRLLERLVAAQSKGFSRSLKLRHLSGMMAVAAELVEMQAAFRDEETKQGVLTLLDVDNKNADFPYRMECIERADETEFSHASEDKMDHLGYQIACIRAEIMGLSDNAFSLKRFPLESLHTVCMHMCAMQMLAFRLVKSDVTIDDDMVREVSMEENFTEASEYPMPFLLYGHGVNPPIIDTDYELQSEPASVALGYAASDAASSLAGKSSQKRARGASSNKGTFNLIL
jgi:hypothetical protein